MARMRNGLALGTSLAFIFIPAVAFVVIAAAGCASGRKVATVAGASQPVPQCFCANVEPAKVSYGGQKSCPVSDKALGSMGPAVPVTLKGRTIYVCCEGCAATVKGDPDTYLKKAQEAPRETH